MNYHLSRFLLTDCIMSVTFGVNCDTQTKSDLVSACQQGAKHAVHFRQANLHPDEYSLTITSLDNYAEFGESS